MLVLDGDQIARLIDAVTGTTLYMPTLIAITTGMRRGEILALRWSGIDLDRGMFCHESEKYQILRAPVQYLPIRLSPSAV